ncbi:oligoribonuclease, mitochondrial-like [Xenia sp. Carnegie-2017]|uniref:oligoribonuclease, mitochondrial-like n=1 Tax=Xenia sp. Carnegie-2017 TaxID=2897299 RepID=UPI001F0434CB|nr:oligoribonuclease, mitochondrial-like [Xenia sp. Carnegie-2017]
MFTEDDLTHFIMLRLLFSFSNLNTIRSFSQKHLKQVRKFYALRKYHSGNMESFSNETRLVWVDLEMSGLDDSKDQILEIACLITDTDLNLIAEGPDIIIHQPDSVLDSMNEWCKSHHGESGLTQAVKESTTSLKQAEDRIIEFITTHTKPNKSLLAGNSVHVDKLFLSRFMPQVIEHLHYRIVDVSTVKELCKYWYPKAYHRVPNKSQTHRALQDIKESLQELKFYKSTIFK